MWRAAGCRRASSRWHATASCSRSRLSARRHPTTRYCIFSCTKPIVASAVWLLIGEGLLDVQRPVGGVRSRARSRRLRHRHRRAGDAAHRRLPQRGDAAARRLGRGAAPRAVRAVGARVGARHTLRVPRHVGALGAGRPHRAAERHRLPRLHRAARAARRSASRVCWGSRNDQLGDVSRARAGRRDDDRRRDHGSTTRAIAPSACPAAARSCAPPTSRCSTKACCATPAGSGTPTCSHDAKTNVRCDFPDNLLQVPVNRTLGLVLAGDDGQALHALRQLRPANSPRSFGHAGAHMHVGWADPETGISFAYCTNGIDSDVMQRSDARAAALRPRGRAHRLTGDG